MAFVGYKTAEEAGAAVKFFDRSFIDTSRLAVEVSGCQRSGQGQSTQR
jgi:hypothetical protein